MLGASTEGRELLSLAATVALLCGLVTCLFAVEALLGSALAVSEELGVGMCVMEADLSKADTLGSFVSRFAVDDLTDAA